MVKPRGGPEDSPCSQVAWTARSRPTRGVDRRRNPRVVLILHRKHLGMKGGAGNLGRTRDRVMVVVRTPGMDAFRLTKVNHRNYAVFTVRKGGSWPCVIVVTERRRQQWPPFGRNQRRDLGPRRRTRASVAARAEGPIIVRKAQSRRPGGSGATLRRTVPQQPLPPVPAARTPDAPR